MDLGCILPQALLLLEQLAVRLGLQRVAVPPLLFQAQKMVYPEEIGEVSTGPFLELDVVSACCIAAGVPASGASLRAGHAPSVHCRCLPS